MSDCSEGVRYCSCYSNIKFISSHHCLIFSKHVHVCVIVYIQERKYVKRQEVVGGGGGERGKFGDWGVSKSVQY